MSLSARMSEDLKDAMRAKRELERETLRMLISAFKNRRIELMRDLTEQDELEVLRTGVKSRRDSAEQYGKGGRPELQKKELAEIEILERYLPRQLDEDATRVAIARIVDEQGLSDPKQLGQLMKALMAAHPGLIDGKLAQKVAADYLKG